MKSKFEKAFKEQAYNAVPDKWEEVKEKAGVSAPEKKEEKVVRFNTKAIASVAASVTIVLVAVSVAVGVGSHKNAPAKAEITVTDENGVAYTITDMSDFDFRRHRGCDQHCDARAPHRHMEDRPPHSACRNADERFRSGFWTGRKHKRRP